MKKQSQVTVKDVARLARVSPGTVSNALSGKRPVSEETRRRILAAIAELDYQPNLLARSLVSRQSATLAVIVSGLEFYGPSRTLIGIEEQANAYGYSLMLSLVHDPDEEQVAPVLQDVVARRADGIIWAIPEIGENRSWIEDDDRLNGLPPVVFLTMGVRAGITIINTDNRAGGRMATEHLLAQGLRRIGLITGPLNWWEARARYAGWQEALAMYNVPEDESLVIEGGWDPASGEAGLAELLQRAPGLEGLVASNDLIALGALRVAHARGLRVPEDLAIVGYDNMPEAAYFWPALTSVRQHLTDIGHLAVDELHTLIEQRREGEAASPAAHRVLLPELVVRRSSMVSHAH